MRRSIVAVLVIAACALAPLAITAYWLKGTLFDTHQYVVTVTPLSSNRAIDDAVASRVTDALLQNVDLAKVQAELPKHTQFLGLALTAGVRDYTQELVVKFLQTSEFRKLWVIANTEAHDALVAVVEREDRPRSSPPTAAWTSTCRTSPLTRARRSGSPGSISTTRLARRRSSTRSS